MALVSPPPPRVIQGDHDGNRRFRMRSFQVMVTLVTLLITAWLCTLGPLPAILGIMVAKHVIVAVILMGRGVNGPRYQAPVSNQDN